MQTGVFAQLHEIGVDHPAAIGSDLNVRESEIAGRPEDGREIGMQRRFAAGELNVPARLRPGGYALEHFADEGRIEEVMASVAVGLREANRTPEIAAVRNVENRQCG